MLAFQSSSRYVDPAFFSMCRSIRRNPGAGMVLQVTLQRRHRVSTDDCVAKSHSRPTNVFTPVFLLETTRLISCSHEEIRTDVRA